MLWYFGDILMILQKLKTFTFLNQTSIMCDLLCKRQQDYDERCPIMVIRTKVRILLIWGHSPNWTEQRELRFELCCKLFRYTSKMAVKPKHGNSQYGISLILQVRPQLILLGVRVFVIHVLQTHTSSSGSGITGGGWWGGGGGQSAPQRLSTGKFLASNREKWARKKG